MRERTEVAGGRATEKEKKRKRKIETGYERPPETPRANVHSQAVWSPSSWSTWSSSSYLLLRLLLLLLLRLRLLLLLLLLSVRRRRPQMGAKRPDATVAAKHKSLSSSTLPLFSSLNLSLYPRLVSALCMYPVFQNQNYFLLKFILMATQRTTQPYTSTLSQPFRPL